MLDQRINAKAFLRMTSLKDIIRYGLGRNKEEYLNSFQYSIDKINDKTHDFNDILSYQIKGKAVYKVNSVASLYYARHINHILKRLYKVKQSNREIITQQINALLTETSPFYVIKGDIANFYESVSREKLIRKLKDDRLLDLRHISVVESFFSNSTAGSMLGIPRGISFSSTLGELFLRAFDEAIRRMQSVYYYARYVDDFIIFTYDDAVSINNIADELFALGLKINKNKTHRFKSSLLLEGKQIINFLGYMHIVDKRQGAVIKISNKRVRKIKTRVVLSFLDFFKNKDIALLDLRIKFLTGNYIINTNQNNDKKLLAGFYYNNSAITDNSQVSDLDRFLMKITNARSGFIPSTLSIALKKKLKEISKRHHFFKGFNLRVVHEIETVDFTKIKTCWDREYIYEKK